MDAILEATLSWAWAMNVFGGGLIAAARLFSNTKSFWAIVGALLLLIAVGNVALVGNYGLNPTATIASLFGVVVHGSLGSRFLGNWLTDSAK
jgi:hypothetical protein